MNRQSLREQLQNDLDLSSEDEMVEEQTGEGDDEPAEVDEVLSDDDSSTDDEQDAETVPEIRDEELDLIARNGGRWSRQPPARPQEIPPILLPNGSEEARNAESAFEYLRLFISDNIIDVIVTHTNTKIQQLRRSYLVRQNYLHDTDATEIWALIALLYFSGLGHSRRVPTEDLWNPLYSPSMYRIGMNRNRFLFLLRALRFDDWRNRNREDKFSPIREIWNMFTVRCIINYNPSTNLTIDETMVSFRGRCPMKTYMKNKPDKYAVKITSLCDSRTSYLCNAWPYLGRNYQPAAPAQSEQQQEAQPARGRSRARSRAGRSQQPSSSRARTRSQNQPLQERATTQGNENVRVYQRKSTRYVLLLVRPYYNSRRIITMDSYFTSSELCSELRDLNLYMVGTIRKSQPEVPEEMKITGRNLHQLTRFCFQNDRMIISYVPKPNKIVLLSSLHSTTAINTATNKSVVIDDYNAHKGSVDCFNGLVKSLSTNRRSRRWPLRLFFFLLDAAATNAYVLMKLKSEILSRRDFLKDLSVECAIAQITRRRSNSHLPMNFKIQIGEFLKKAGFEPAENEPIYLNQERDASGRPTKACAICENPNKRRATTWCDLCNRPTCGSHHNKIKICIVCVPDATTLTTPEENSDEFDD